MRICKRLICTILTGILVFTAVLPVSATDLQNQLNDAETQGDQLQSQKDAAQQKIDSLNSQLNSLNTEIASAQASITSKNSEIEKAEEDLTAAKLEEENQYNAMKLRIRYMYESGGSVFVVLFLEASDISDLINKVEYVNQLSTYDRNKLTEFQTIRTQVEEQEAKLQSEYDELTQLQASLEEKQSEVEGLVNDQTSLLAELETSLGENAELVSGLRTKLAAYNAQVAAAAAAKAAAAQQAASHAGESVVSGTGQFTNPCPAGYLSSGFGYRTYDNAFHKGIDLACSAGSPIYAADSGTVIIAGYSATAGNWIVIDHGGGLVTKYMHASALYVSAGQSVSKGQNIAAVGSTGNSSGNHLHFQVEVNGTAVNPYLYL